METEHWSGRRIAGVAGIGFGIVAILLLALSGDGPAYDDTAAEVREFFVDDDWRVHLVSWLSALAFVFLLLPFAAGLRSVLAAAEMPDDPIWSRLSYSGAVIAAAIGGVSAAFWEVLSQGVAETAADDTVVALARFDTVIFTGVLPWALALFVGAASVVILRSALLARWIGWLGAAAATLSVVGTLWLFAEDDEATIAYAGFIGLPLTILWVVVIAVAMLRSRRPVAAPVT
ncbi:MAG: hypothetical protein M5U14_05765 [Acidimicrobiia bacterium]|nr:hypothetical protein [Acidimicrobiia bacterium]